MYKKIAKTTIVWALAVVMLLSSTAFAASPAIEPDDILQTYSENLSAMYQLPELPGLEQSDIEIFDLPVADLEEFDYNSSIDAAFSSVGSQSQGIGAASANATTTTASVGGTWVIDENTMYSDSLLSADDYTVYLCVITANGEATAFLNSSSTMGFMMEALVFTDTSLSTQRTEGFSDVSHALYGGQRIRFKVYAGEVLAILVAKKDSSTFASNIYTVGVLRHGNIGDSYEPNNHPQGATNMGTASTSAIIRNGEIDSQFDIDWYKFSYTNQSCYTYLAFSAGTGVSAYVFTMDGDGQLQPFMEIARDGVWRHHTNTTARTYYVGVYSPTGTYGGYYSLGVQLSPIFVVDKRVIVDFSSVTGDMYLKSFGALGSRQTAKTNVNGTIRITDIKGNPITGFPYYIAFETSTDMLMGGTLDIQEYSTGYDGVGSAALSFSGQTVGRWRFINKMSYWESWTNGMYSYYNAAKITVYLPDDYSHWGGSGASYLAATQYGGELHEDYAFD